MKVNIKKMILTAMMAGIAFVLNTFVYFPAMAPFQHCVNVIATAFLGPWYGCLAAFICGVLRMMSGRTIQAIVGAVFGPIIGGLLYKETKNNKPLREYNLLDYKDTVEMTESFKAATRPGPSLAYKYPCSKITFCRALSRRTAVPFFLPSSQQV